MRLEDSSRMQTYQEIADKIEGNLLKCRGMDYEIAEAFTDIIMDTIKMAYIDGFKDGESKGAIDATDTIQRVMKDNEVRQMTNTYLVYGG